MRIYYGLFLVWTVRIYSKVLASHEDITWRGHRQFSGIFEIILFNFQFYSTSQPGILENRLQTMKKKNYNAPVTNVLHL